MKKTVRLSVSLVLLVSAGSVVSAGSSPCEETVQAIETQLNDAQEYDEPIVLTEGTDFLGPPGTVIFLPRDLGAEKLLEFARSGEPEVGMLFLPQWEAWITSSKERTLETIRFYSAHIEAAIGAGLEVEYWHTHNNATSERLTSEELLQRYVQWTMPSAQDLLTFYGFSHDYQGANLRGVIASGFGITTYWNSDPTWAIPEYVMAAVQNEARLLFAQTSQLSPAELPKFVQNHDGFVKLHFEPIADDTPP